MKEGKRGRKKRTAISEINAPLLFKFESADGVAWKDEWRKVITQAQRTGGIYSKDYYIKLICHLDIICFASFDRLLHIPGSLTFETLLISNALFHFCIK